MVNPFQKHLGGRLPPGYDRGRITNLHSTREEGAGETHRCQPTTDPYCPESNCKDWFMSTIDAVAKAKCAHMIDIDIIDLDGDEI